MGRVALKRTHKVKQRNKEGICRIIQDGKGCKREVHGRGLCAKHQSYFSRHGTIEKYAAKLQYTYVDETNYKVNKKHKPKQCRVFENGKPCNRSFHGRGLCGRNYLVFFTLWLVRKVRCQIKKRHSHLCFEEKNCEGYVPHD